MRLVSRVDRIERRAAQQALVCPDAGICWTQDEARLARALEPGEHLAVDVDLLSGGDCPQVKTAERPSREAGDYGLVREAGEVVGRVMAPVRGRVLRWERVVRGAAG